MMDKPCGRRTERKKNKGGKPLPGVVLAQAAPRPQEHGEEPPKRGKVRKDRQSFHSAPFFGCPRFTSDTLRLYRRFWKPFTTLRVVKAELFAAFGAFLVALESATHSQGHSPSQASGASRRLYKRFWKPFTTLRVVKAELFATSGRLFGCP